MNETHENGRDSDFRIERLDDGIVFHLTREAKRNAITRAILLALAACLDELESDPGKRLLIVTGEGERAFCAGTDLSELSAMSESAQMAKTVQARELFVRLSRSPIISVAAINGLAFGGGLELAMACMMRVAVSDATACLPEIRLGLLPAYGGTQFLPMLIGPGRALDMMLTARIMASDEALVSGLYNRIASSRERLLDEALELARSISRYPRNAVAAIRDAVWAAGPSLSDAGLACEAAGVRTVFASASAHEGVAAFLAKRPPEFGSG